MPQTRSFYECRAFVDAVVAAHGDVPTVLQNLIAGSDLVDSHSAVQAPAMGLVDQLANGKLDSKKLTALIEAAAHQQAVADYVGGLRPALEPVFVTRFHAALRDGAADQILDSLRGRFDVAAEAIAAAKSELGSGESTLEHVLEDAGPGLVGAWQSLPKHLSTVAGIAKVAAQFGCRQTAAFSLVKEYSLADNFGVHDYALACTAGGLIGDSALFSGPSAGRTGSPFYRAGGLKLHSIEEMQQRYNTFASAEWDRVHDGRARGGHIEPDGTTVYDEPQPNPYERQDA